MQIKRGLGTQLKSRNIFIKFLPLKLLEEHCIYSAAQRLNLKDLQENIKQLGSTIPTENTT